MIKKIIIVILFLGLLGAIEISDGIGQAKELLESNGYLVTKLEETDGVLGLKWGMSSEEVKKIYKLGEPSEGKLGLVYAISDGASKIVDAKYVFLYFLEDKLWRVWVRGKTTENDPYGTVTKIQYSKLKEILVKKYDVKSQEYIPVTGYYSESNKFVYTLQTGEGWYYSDFNSRDKLVSGQLAINVDEAKGYDDASYWYLMYEYAPVKEHMDSSKTQELENSL